MRQRIKPVARWPARPINLLGNPNNLDSRIFHSVRRHYTTYRQQEAQLELHPCSSWLSYSQSCRGLPACCRHGSRHILRLLSRRRFSVSNPQRGDDGFDDDDGFGDFEDFAENKQNLSSLVRKRSGPVRSLENVHREKEAKRLEEERLLKAKLEQEAREKKQRERRYQQESNRILVSLQEIEKFAQDELPGLQSMAELVAERKERARREREERERRRAHMEFIRQYGIVMSKADTLNNVDQSLLEELFAIKYPKATMVETEIPTLKAALSDLEKQYETCKLALQICTLQRERAVLEMELVEVNNLLSSVAQDLDILFAGPQTSGRNNIDNLLQPKFAYLSSYLQTQEIAFKIRNTGRSILAIVRDLASMSRRYAFLLHKVKDPRDMLAALHQYRYMVRMIEFYRPMGHTQVHSFASNMDGFGREVVGLSRADYKFPYKYVVAKFLAHWYRMRWTPCSPRDPKLDITWRYVDVVHPFDVARVYEKIVNNMVANIALALKREGATPAHLKFSQTLEDWVQESAVKYGPLEAEVTSLRYITWARLQTESKMHALGDIPDTISRGLFCSPNPLSQDPRKFFAYTDTFASLSAIAMVTATELNFRRNGLLKEDVFRMKASTVRINAYDPEKSAANQPPKDTTTKRGRYRLGRAAASPSTAKSSGKKTEKTTSKKVKKKAAKQNGNPKESSSAQSPLPSATPEAKVGKGRKRRKRKGKSQSMATTAAPEVRKVESTTSSIATATPIPKPKVRKVESTASSTATTASPAPKVRKVQSTVSSNVTASPELKVRKVESTVSLKSTTVTPGNEASKTEQRKFKVRTVLSTASTATPSNPPKRGYSTSSRSCSSRSLEEELSSVINGVNEESFSSVERKAWVASDIRQTQAESPTVDSPTQFWSHKNHQGRNGKEVIVHYCRTFESAERVAKLFSESTVVGFDIEWKAQSTSTAGVKSNVSLVQIADQDRIALFHIALFRASEEHGLTPPSLKRILECADTVKVGVNIKADCTRLRRYLGIGVQSQLELSHLYKLVKYGQSNPELVNRRVVNLSQQVEEILGFPLYKEDDVRCSDWSRPLDYDQVHYAASDPFACVCLYHALELKRKALDPIPPAPAYAELNLPILIK